jgi:hypothetical protein
MRTVRPAGEPNGGRPGLPLPWAPAFSLLARVNGDYAWTNIGEQATFINLGVTTEPLKFRINDSSPGDGSGAFTASYVTCDMSDAPASQHTVSRVVARHSEKCLDVAEQSVAHEADVVQGTCWTGTNQQWTARPVEGGYYQIVARHSGKCLDVAHESREHEADVIQGVCSGPAGTNQHWTFEPTADGYYKIVARHSGMCLDVAHQSHDHAADVVQGSCWGGTNQQWRFESATR